MKIYPEDRGPVGVNEVLGALFTARGWGRRTERAALEAAWAEAAGPVVAAESRVMRISRGVLEVEVRQSVMLMELAQFQKRTLLATLRTLHPRPAITDLKLRLGAW
ncbi:MAG: DUF721 domain-containing protein [Fimbriiglobus sp.]